MRAIFFVSILWFHFTVFAQTSITFTTLFEAKSIDNVACYRIPALITAQNGDLLAAIDQRVPSCNDLRDNPDINIVLRRSSDDGETWSEMEKIVDFPLGKSASDPSFILNERTGKIFLFYNYMDLKKEKGVYYLHVMHSKDHGLTWSRPTDITDRITQPEWHTDFKFITSGRGIQTNSGRLLHTLVNIEKGLYLFSGDGDGKSFSLIDTPLKPGDESKVVELADSNLMVNSRVNNAGLRYSHVSKNQGKTWHTAPIPSLLDPGCNASIIRYTLKAEGHSKNRLLFANANSEKERKNMTVRVSYDEGKTWSEGKTIYKGPSAYSSLSILKSGDIGLFFEKDYYTENVFTKFSLEWLTDGADTYKKASK